MRKVVCSLSSILVLLLSVAAYSRAKKGIRDIGRGLKFIKALRLVEFKMNQRNERIDFGFITQTKNHIL